MADLLHRRDVLAAAIQHLPLPIRAEHLAAANAAAGFSAHRNTARKDARALVKRGLLAPAPGSGNRTYTRTETTITTYLRCPAGNCRHLAAYNPDSDAAHDALVEHVVTEHQVPRGDAAGSLVSQARTVTR